MVCKFIPNVCVSSNARSDTINSSDLLSEGFDVESVLEMPQHERQHRSKAMAESSLFQKKLEMTALWCSAPFATPCTVVSSSKPQSLWERKLWPTSRAKKGFSADSSASRAAQLCNSLQSYNNSAVWRKSLMHPSISGDKINGFQIP